MDHANEPVASVTGVPTYVSMDVSIIFFYFLIFFSRFSLLAQSTPTQPAIQPEIQASPDDTGMVLVCICISVTTRFVLNPKLNFCWIQ